MVDAQVVSGFFPANVREAYANQAAYCRANSSPSTARIVTAIAARLDDADPGPFVRRIRDWPGSPLGDGLPLRSAAGLRSLFLSGKAPDLGPIYADRPADDEAVVAAAIAAHEDELSGWLDSPPQTNEAGRSSSFIAALLWLAGRGLPARFECLEIGSSAGINLMIDRYAYDLGGVKVGPERPVMRLSPEWRGAPPPDRAIAFASLRGCDVSPVDLADPDQAIRLRSYCWAELAVRLERLDAAIAEVNRRPPDLVRMNAADFIERELARPQAEGTTRVMMHSVVWQYVPQDQRDRIVAAMERAGGRATPGRPLAWIALEGNRKLLNHGLSVRTWPGGGKEHLIAAAHAHGAWIEWLGD